MFCPVSSRNTVLFFTFMHNIIMNGHIQYSILVFTFLHNILVIPYQEIIENVYFFVDIVCYKYAFDS
jgi:hypothetical protein